MLDHHYLSTACLHASIDPNDELHDYCKSPQRHDGGNKKPAKCKFCDAKCKCFCHVEEPE